MSEWHFTCGCAMGRLGGRGTLILDADGEEDAHQKAKGAGWIVNWDEYPGVACSQACWDKAHDEWERSRPRREAAARRLREEKAAGLWDENWRWVGPGSAKASGPLGGAGGGQ